MHVATKRTLRIGVSEAEPYEKHHGSSERAGRIEKRIPGRSRTAKHKRLMNLVERRITRRDRQRGQGPGPAPARPVTSHAAKDQNAEDKIFREMSRLSYEVMDYVDLVYGKRRKEPVEYRNYDFACVVR